MNGSLRVKMICIKGSALAIFTVIYTTRTSSPLFITCTTTHYRSTKAEFIPYQRYGFSIYFHSGNAAREGYIVDWLVFYKQIWKNWHCLIETFTFCFLIKSSNLIKKSANLLAKLCPLICSYLHMDYFAWALFMCQ